MTMRIDRLTGEDLEVEVLPEAGARLHRVRAFGHDVMRTPDDPAKHFDDPFYWGGYHMLPWTNRIAPGPTRVGARTLDLCPNFKDGTAIHGLHYITPWEVQGEGRYSAQGDADSSGWPWPYSVGVDVLAEGLSLRLVHRVTNESDDPMPAGAGIHPWFLEPVELRIRARLQIASNNDPAAPHQPVTAELDMSTFRPLPEEADAAWANVDQPAFELRWPELGIVGAMRTRQLDAYVVAAKPPGAVDAIAVEPQTHAPWGLRRMLDSEPGGLTMLAPGASLTLESTLTFSRTEEAQP
jgi:aldose 1-epimerase